MDLNKVMLIGRLTRDPETKTIPSGVTVTTFGLATGRVWKDDKGVQHEATEFHNIVAWRRLGEIAAQYLAKGRQVYVEGHLQTRSWDKDNVKHYRTEVVMDNMIMLGNKGDSSTGSRPAAQYNSPAQPQSMPETPIITPAPASDEEIHIEDIPF